VPDRAGGPGDHDRHGSMLPTGHVKHLQRALHLQRPATIGAWNAPDTTTPT
jgi:hypothetical protein